MAKINMVLPEEVHQLFKQLQHELHLSGDKRPLGQLYLEAMTKGVKQLSDLFIVDTSTSNQPPERPKRRGRSASLFDSTSK